MFKLAGNVRDYSPDFLKNLGTVYVKYFTTSIFFRVYPGARVKPLHEYREPFMKNDKLREMVGLKLLAGEYQAAKCILDDDCMKDHLDKLNKAKVFTHFQEHCVRFSSEYVSPFKPTIPVAKTTVDPTCNRNSHQLEEFLEYKFHRKELLEEALLHRSVYGEQYSYRRLAHLGDALIERMIADHVVSTTSIRSGFELDKVSRYLLSNLHFAKLTIKNKFYQFVLHNNDPQIKSLFLEVSSKNLDVDSWVTINAAKKENKKNKSLGDQLEALICAVYFDTNCSLIRGWHVFKPFFDDSLSYTLNRYDYQDESINSSSSGSSAPA